MDWVTIGSRIRKQRECFGYTRESFAEKLGITPKFCADIELGNKGMSVQTLCNIASILKLSTDYILFGDDANSQSSSILTLQRCSPLEQKYAEEMLSIFLKAMECKSE
jgi:transcriptional regulator with XRE-family HTH domain